MKTARAIKTVSLIAIVCGLLPAIGEMTPIELARKLNEAFIEVAEKVSPSVVVIKVSRRSGFVFEFDSYEFRFWDLIPKEFRRRFFGEPPQLPKPRRQPQFTSQGSGIIIREDGYILTNSHVVEDAERIRIRLKDGREFDAEVRGVDTRSDIAVLKIKDPNVKGLKVAKLGDSSKVRVGEFVIAIGAPYDLEYTVTIGHVSAKGRSQIIPDPAMDQDFIQTDASINPGNSGGPLVNINGEVIGINTLIRGLRTGIGFAIPINLAREVAEKLITEGKFTRPWLGISIVSLTDAPEYRNFIKGTDEGVVVSAIHPDGPASKSDLKPADVITAIDGKQVNTAQQLKDEIRNKKIGNIVTLDVIRNGKPVKVKIKTEPFP
ncbi:MAG: S1C family serine protease, partial [Limisphaerales bacterium]